MLMKKKDVVSDILLVVATLAAILPVAYRIALTCGKEPLWLVVKMSHLKNHKSHKS